MMAASAFVQNFLYFESGIAKQNIWRIVIDRAYILLRE